MQRYNPKIIDNVAVMHEDSRGEYVKFNDIVCVMTFRIDEVENGVAYGLLYDTYDDYPSFTLEIPVCEMNVEDELVLPGTTFICVLDKPTQKYSFKRVFSSYCKWNQAQIDQIHKDAAEMLQRLKEMPSNPPATGIDTQL